MLRTSIAPLLVAASGIPVFDGVPAVVLLYGVPTATIAYLPATTPAAYNSLTYFAVGVVQTFANILSATIPANSADVGVPGFC